MNETWQRIRRRLSPGGTPSLPELYPGEKGVDSIEIAHDADAAGLDVPGPKDEFLDSGRITLAAPGDAEDDR
ncbi:hypothetical protein ACTXMW_16160 [Brachybacterium paraconglomeratum]|uniref:hypothetical protein n=1 Tax=Brachybacterium paraconglomeratum TaxID=173362 RepID=UPI003FD5C6F6